MTSPHASPDRRRHGRLVGAGIFLAVLAAFASARHGGFLLWDDHINIVENPHLQPTWENLRWMFSDVSYMRRYVPLAWLNWSIEAALFGLTPQSAHAGNILLHAANAVLVFLLLQRLLVRRTGAGQPAAPGVTFAAGIGSLFWALHPLRVEVVAWASGRMYGQAAGFFLVSLLAYLRAVGHPPRTTAYRGWMIVAVAAFAASLLSYPIALPLVALLVILDWFGLRRFQPGGWWRNPVNRAVWREKIPFLLVAAATAGITLTARINAGGIWDPPPTLAEFGVLARLMQAAHVWIYYVWRPLFPVGLAPVYSTLLEFDPLAPAFLLNAVVLVAVTTVLIRRRREWPVALALWLSHLCLLAPMLGLTEHPHYTNDRYSYLQGLLWSVAIATGVVRVWRLQVRRSILVAAGLALVALGVCSTGQIAPWRDNETFFRSLYASVGQGKARADVALRLGDVLRTRLQFDEAADLYRESLRLEPGLARSAVPHYGLGCIAHYRQRHQEAFDHYLAAIKLDPRLAGAFKAMGILLVQQGKPADAVAFAQRATELAPGDADAHDALGAALLGSGREAAAVEAYRAVVRIHPDKLTARCNLAAALCAAGHVAEALAWCEETIRRMPRSAEARLKHSEVLRSVGRHPEALAAAREAVRLKPDAPENLIALGLALGLTRHWPEAADAFHRAVQLDPNSAHAHLLLGLALRDSGRTNEAVEALASALRLQPDLAAAREEISRLSGTPAVGRR